MTSRCCRILHAALFATLFFATAPYALSEVVVPRHVEFLYPLADHSAYSYLSRLELSSRVPIQSRIRPYLMTRSVYIRGDTLFGKREYARYEFEGKATWELSRGSVRYWRSAWTDFRVKALGDSRWVTWIYQDGIYFGSKEIHPRGYSKSGFAVGVQPVYGFESISTDDDRGTITRFTAGARFEGGYASKLRFMVDFRDNTESGNGPYWTRNSLYEDRWASVDLKGKSSTSYDVSESFIQYYGKDLSIAAGRGRHRWGPGQFGGLFLNSNAPPFDYVRFDAALENEQTPPAIYYTFLHGFLESATPAETLYTNPDGRPRTINAQKFLSAQRLEVRPRGNVLLGFSQGVVYGDRGLQLGYLTPLNFLYSVQHSNDDKDNFVLGLDGTWRVVRGLKLYGEAFFDDILVGDLFNSTGNNKSAYTIGAHGIVPKPFWSKFDLKLEYTKVRPFVYTHIFGVNAYSHWYSPLGYTREPNSEFITTELRGTFYPVQVTLHWSRQNHGADTASKIVGGNIYTGNYEGNNTEFPFLAGEFERTSRMGVRVSWEVLPNLTVFGEGMQIEESKFKDRLETHLGFGWNL